MSNDTDKQGANESGGRGLLKEMGALYVAALLLILGCVLLASAVPLVSQNLYALVAAIFVGLPYWWLSRREMNFDRFGLTWDGAGRGVLWGLLLTVLTLGPFALGYWWWETEVHEREFHWSVDNLYQWPVEFDGRPNTGPDDEGVAVWADGPTLRVQITADDEPIVAELSADERFDVRTAGHPHLEPIGAERGEPVKRYRIRVEPRDPSAYLEIGADGARAPPRSLTIRARAAGGEPAPIYRGASGDVTHEPVELDRGLNWMLLWALTHLVFIAFPEEFFYRGYLQTRIKDALGVRRKEEGQKSGDAKEWRLLGLISASNLITSALFAIGHLVIPIGGVFSVSRASVFFPSLVFGWLRERTGTIAAPVVYHAAANMMILFAAPHFY